MTSCLVCLTLYALFTPTGELQPLHAPIDWIMAIMLGLVPTVISLVFMAMAIQCIGSTPTAIMGALEPVTAAILGILIFGEVLTPRIALGIALILFSVTLIILDSKLRNALSNTKVIRKGRIIIKRIRWK